MLKLYLSLHRLSWSRMSSAQRRNAVMDMLSDPCFLLVNTYLTSNPFAQDRLNQFVSWLAFADSYNPVHDWTENLTYAAAVDAVSDVIAYDNEHPAIVSPLRAKYRNTSKAAGHAARKR